MYFIDPVELEQQVRHLRGCLMGTNVLLATILFVLVAWWIMWCFEDKLPWFKKGTPHD